MTNANQALANPQKPNRIPFGVNALTPCHNREYNFGITSAWASFCHGPLASSIPIKPEAHPILLLKSKAYSFLCEMIVRCQTMC